MSKEREFKAKWRKFNYKEWQELDKKYDRAAWDACFKHCVTASTIENWTEQMEEATKKAMAECGGHPPFAPHAWYNAEMDILEVYLSDEPHYAKWLNPQITVLLDDEHNEVVGFKIYALSRVERLKEIVERIGGKGKEDARATGDDKLDAAQGQAKRETESPDSHSA